MGWWWPWEFVGWRSGFACFVVVVVVVVVGVMVVLSRVSSTPGTDVSRCIHLSPDQETHLPIYTLHRPSLTSPTPYPSFHLPTTLAALPQSITYHANLVSGDIHITFPVTYPALPLQYESFMHHTLTVCRRLARSEWDVAHLPDMSGRQQLQGQGRWELKPRISVLESCDFFLLSCLRFLVGMQALLCCVVVEFTCAHWRCAGWLNGTPAQPITCAIRDLEKTIGGVRWSWEMRTDKKGTA